VKVQDLSKEIGKNVKEFIRFLSEMGVKAKSGSTRLDDSVVEEIRALFKGETPQDKERVDAFTWDKPTITIQQLLTQSKVQIGDLMRGALMKGLMVNVNSEIPLDTARELVAAFNVTIETSDSVAEPTLKANVTKIREAELSHDSGSLITRPPVITIMGHVDHGKTLLLDTIRQSNVVDGEAGGITQHIGAYQVEIHGRKLTFLDTPGHAAFTALRARGAQVTDIVILVVAADEGIRPQTIEAIDHARAANVPIVVAINKMDKPDANPEKVKQDLATHDLVSEDWGGSTVMLPISAKKKQGITELLEMLVLMADVQDLKASITMPAKAVIIESHLSRQRGAVATVLIKSGTLRVGDHFIIDGDYGKVRAMRDDLGKEVSQATPGAPVEILGISSVPSPGSILEVFKEEKEAKKEAELRRGELETKKRRALSLESLSQQIQEGDLKPLNLVVKADVNGSLEAIVASINDLKTGNVHLQIIHYATGDVNENDVMLAIASQALVICFNVGVNAEARRLADSEAVSIRHYRIIYEILDDINKSIKGLYTPEYEEVKTGVIEVRQLFKFSKVGVIAGSYVTEGKVQRNSIATVTRNGQEIYKGKIESLKRFKDDVKEVTYGFECGVVLDDFSSLQEGDIITAYISQEKHRS
jgi:translation initiation factor IF-2